MTAAMGVGLKSFVCLNICTLECSYLSDFFSQTVAKIMGNPFALGGIVGDGKRPEDSDKMLNKIEHYPEFDVGLWFCSTRISYVRRRYICSALFSLSQSDTQNQHIAYVGRSTLSTSSRFDPTPRAGLGLSRTPFMIPASFAAQTGY